MVRINISRLAALPRIQTWQAQVAIPYVGQQAASAADSDATAGKRTQDVVDGTTLIGYLTRTI